MKRFEVITMTGLVLSRGYENETNTWITWRLDFELSCAYSIGDVGNALSISPLAHRVVFEQNGIPKQTKQNDVSVGDVPVGQKQGEYPSVCDFLNAGD